MAKFYCYNTWKLLWIGWNCSDLYCVVNCMHWIYHCKRFALIFSTLQTNVSLFNGNSIDNAENQQWNTLRRWIVSMRKQCNIKIVVFEPTDIVWQRRISLISEYRVPWLILYNYYLILSWTNIINNSFWIQYAPFGSCTLIYWESISIL